MSCTYPATQGGRVAALILTAGLTGVAGAQQFQEETDTRFPSPNPADFTNQLSIGDLDGDGDLDLVFANGGDFQSEGDPEPQRVWMNDGGGVFTDESEDRLGGFTGLCRGVEMGDIDRDGDLDLIFAQDFELIPALFENDGTGHFTDVSEDRLPQTVMSSSRAQFGDIDNDGDLDIYITDGGANRFGCGQYRVWVNDGDGFFTDETVGRVPLVAECNNMDCLFGDIDNDFDLDIKTASTGTDNSRLYRNNGQGVFTKVINIPPDSTCYSYDFGDMDGDGDLDLVGANAGPGSAELLLQNDGTGRYTNVSGRISPNPSQDDNDSKFFDYDNDGDLDLIIARLGSGGEKIYNNDGGGNFTLTSGVIQVISDSSLDIMVADLTGNGKLDIVTAQGESGNFQNRIYVNSGPADTIPPRIVKTERLLGTEDATGPYVVRALILDGMTSDRNFFDTGVHLNWTVDAGPVQQSEMVHSGGQVYRGELPGPGVASTVEYWVTASDFAGNLGTGATTTFEVTGTAGDVNGDGAVDFDDLLEVLSNWGDCVPGPECPADLDGDGTVGFADLLLVLANWT